MERVIDWPHQADKFFVHDPHELLGGVQRIQHLRSDGIGYDPVQKLVGDVVRDISLKQGCAHPLKSLAHIRFRQPAAASQSA